MVKEGDPVSDIENLSGHTHMCALIANPIRHTKAVGMHNASFAHQGIDSVYLCFEVENEQLPALVQTFKTIGGVDGYNVSMPNKMEICQYLDELTDAARLMGAVNTVEHRDGKAIGHNTDGAGFMRNIKEHGFECVGKRMVMTGAGGAGSAIMVQAALDGMAAVDVFNIKDDAFYAAREKAALVSEETGCRVTIHDLDDRETFGACCQQADILVNSTRVGMKPLDDQCLFPEEFIKSGIFVCDVPYNPIKTTLLKMAEAKGCVAIDGIGMMLWQGAIAEKIWYGFDMDMDYVRGLVEQHLDL